MIRQKADSPYCNSNSLVAQRPWMKSTELNDRWTRTCDHRLKRIETALTVPAYPGAVSAQSHRALKPMLGDRTVHSTLPCVYLGSFFFEIWVLIELQLRSEFLG